jgi:hypothetical protein
MLVNPDLQYRLWAHPDPKQLKSPCHILAVTEIEPNHTKRTSGNSPERKPPFQSRKKKPAQGLVFFFSLLPFFILTFILHVYYEKGFNLSFLEN